MPAQHTRFLYTNDQKTFYRFLSFSQSNNDFSIYCWWPGISASEQIFLNIVNNSPSFTTKPIPPNTKKISFHGSGMTYMSGEKSGKRTPHGQPLYISEGNKIFPKHLCTFFPSETALKGSAFDKTRNESDTILASDKHTPFIILLFAIPQTKQGLKIHVTSMFPQDLIGEHLSEFLDFGKISLQNHDVIWIGYKPPNLTWPKKSIIAYEDGITVPIFYPLQTDHAKKMASMKILYTKPEYHYSDNHLDIAIPFTTSLE